MATLIGLCSGSLGRWPVVGRNALASSPFWSDGDIANVGGQHIFNWEDGIGDTSTEPWKTIADGLTNNPGTDGVWFVPLWGGPDADKHGCFGAADRDAIVAVSDELRNLIAGVEIIMSASPNFQPLSLCSGWVLSQYNKSVDATSWALANGYADTAGPVLTPITEDTNNGPLDPCHQGVGQTPGFLDVSDHPQILVDAGL